MNTLEEIPYTKEETKAMVKTIAQLRKENNNSKLRGYALEFSCKKWI